MSDVLENPEVEEEKIPIPEMEDGEREIVYEDEIQGEEGESEETKVV